MKKQEDTHLEYKQGNSTIRESLFTYNEQEQEDIRIAKSNSGHIFNPEFIPYYPAIQKQYDLRHLEVLTYGFLRFYLANGSGKFYFTSKQIGKVIGCAPGTAANCIMKLKNLGLIKTSHKVKANGGTIRFIHIEQSRLHQMMNSNFTKRLSLTSSNDETNNNKINNNKIKESGFSLKRFEKEKINILEEAQSKYQSKNCKKALEDFLEQIEIKGYKYKNYKLAFLKWVREDRFKQYSNSIIQNNLAVKGNREKYEHL